MSKLKKILWNSGIKKFYITAYIIGNGLTYSHTGQLLYNYVKSKLTDTQIHNFSTHFPLDSISQSTDNLGALIGLCTGVGLSSLYFVALKFSKKNLEEKCLFYSQNEPGET